MGSPQVGHFRLSQNGTRKAPVMLEGDAQGAGKLSGALCDLRWFAVQKSHLQVEQVGSKSGGLNKTAKK